MKLALAAVRKKRAMGINIDFEFNQTDDSARSGFDLGYVKLTGSRGSVDSRPRDCMVYLTIVDMLDGLRRLLSGTEDEYELVATDSSFIVYFEADEHDRITVTSQGTIIEVDHVRSIAGDILGCVKTFWATPGNALSPKDAVFGDVRAAMSDLEAELSE